MASEDRCNEVSRLRRRSTVPGRAEPRSIVDRLASTLVCREQRVGQCQDPAPGSFWDSSIMLSHGSRKKARRRLMSSMSKG
ncbi:hypothetical protein GCM10025734_73840 [Kitasatospora paranensis]